MQTVLTDVQATVVFSGVAVARKCREDFHQLAKKKGPYRGIQVSYSHDPCERPLHLVTQMNDPNATNTAKRALNRIGNPYRTSSSSYTNGSSRARGSSPVRPIRPRAYDQDGWQTVGRRR